ncbi:MAG: DUF3786 domain-containing protein [Chloroflexi bacterium]|nr:DUF3786 domain-containing protein [Chloroflexota bacterium]
MARVSHKEIIPDATIVVYHGLDNLVSSGNMVSNAWSLANLRDQEYGFGLAYRLARERLASIDVEQQCLKSGAAWRAADSGKVITVDYLNRSYYVTFPEGEVSLTGSEEAVPTRDKILVLHYLIHAKGTPLSNKMITYKELPEGTSYFPVFTKRSIKPLLDHFSSDPQRLLSLASGVLGGRKTDFGDIAVTIDAFSRVPVTLVLWRGDEEFPPQGSILFDGNISDYLSTEDVTVLCETIAWKLVKQIKSF